MKIDFNFINKMRRLSQPFENNLLIHRSKNHVKKEENLNYTGSNSKYRTRRRGGVDGGVHLWYVEEMMTKATKLYA